GPPGLRVADGLAGHGHLNLNATVADDAPDDVFLAVGIDALLEDLDDATGEFAGAFGGGGFGHVEFVDQRGAAGAVGANAGGRDFFVPSTVCRDDIPAGEGGDQDDDDESGGEGVFHFSSVVGGQWSEVRRGETAATDHRPLATISSRLGR